MIDQATLAITAAGGVLLTSAAAPDVDILRTDAIVESFDEHMGAWTARGNIACYSFGCPIFHWEVIRTTDEAHQGAFSLDMTTSGQWDDGVVWVERPIQLEPGTWDISLVFHLHDIVDSPINSYPVTAYIEVEPPQDELDFEIIGHTGHKGWTPYEYSRTLSVQEPTTAWVALGYSVTWESCRTFHVDSVTISGIPPQSADRPGDLTHDGVVNVADLLLLLENWGPCPHEAHQCFCTNGDDCTTESPDSDCLGDITGSATTDVEDLLLLLSNWG